ncbi:MAG: tRNA (adenosine(37)-N6)-dimethylallyltransferase MiaA [Floccifex porci]|uniref:tRNA (adenosine(37)-N6)-dimethylallyltransferase MiaA n=1 Tax=Floccifex porci TaxID=2606629 RepID=UPI0023EFF085|nr:tRNA (adenosine(37)-N6)-dimethylallyltransferase MiaA [Floccifex porci]MDD7467182.1 tRNA (adenosine(37)-N6)-dimethylallyltransferase MiaA [Floccifex porci]MDY4796726.1 tRNA (adenosine(37)-N6)-dimethylallyltransferase MiaA [Floccifex porci]
MDKKIIAIVGPTGIGKTSLSIELAKALNGEVISCDSMQVYKKMDIGTAKVTKEEMDGIFHYLIDIQEYDQPYNVMIFQDVCRKSIQKIQNKNKQVILCGGTGLYLKAALYDYTFEEETQDEDYLKELNQKSNEELYELLKEIDEKSLEKIHKNNRKRILRALMMAHSGMSKSQREQQQKHIPLYDIYYIGLDVDRNILHQRINDRVDKMFEQGLVEEVTSLFKEEKTWEYTSFQGIGYKEFKDYFLDQITLEETKERIKTHSRQYAKRQYTWFKNQMPVHWYSIDQKEQILKDVKQWLKGEI